MVTEPPSSHLPTPPAPVGDRRRPGRRRYGDVPEERPELSRTALAIIAAISGGLVVIFVFFWALGAIDITHAVWTTIAVLLLAAVWFAGYLYRRRGKESEEYNYASKRDRERRGF